MVRDIVIVFRVHAGHVPDVSDVTGGAGVSGAARLERLPVGADAGQNGQQQQLSYVPGARHRRTKPQQVA